MIIKMMLMKPPFFGRTGKCRQTIISRFRCGRPTEENIQNVGNSNGRDLARFDDSSGLQIIPSISRNSGSRSSHAKTNDQRQRSTSGKPKKKQKMEEKFERRVNLNENSIFFVFQRLLVCNPALRLSAEGAMAHPYFNDLNPALKNDRCQ